MELEMVAYVLRSLTDRPDCFELERTVDERGVLINVMVDKDQLGRVIGKQGNTANSIRTLLHALGLKNQARYSMKISERVVSHV